MGGEAHDGEVGAGEVGDGGEADPVLGAVGAGFVEGAVAADVVVDFGIGQLGEGDGGPVAEEPGLFAKAEAFRPADARLGPA